MAHMGRERVSLANGETTLAEKGGKCTFSGKRETTLAEGVESTCRFSQSWRNVVSLLLTAAAFAVRVSGYGQAQSRPRNVDRTWIVSYGGNDVTYPYASNSKLTAITAIPAIRP